MSREILFRSKREPSDEYVYFEDGEYFYIQDNEKWWANSDDFKWKNKEQFTGLTDKNGVKIFEGDNVIEGNGSRYTVKFIKGVFVALSENYKSNDIGITLSYLPEIEVIPKEQK